MPYGPFERGTVLDLTVNAVPLAILLFFIALFVLYRPFPPDPFDLVVSVLLLVIPFVLLAILSYVAGLAIQASEA